MKRRALPFGPFSSFGGAARAIALFPVCEGRGVHRLYAMKPAILATLLLSACTTAPISGPCLVYKMNRDAVPTSEGFLVLDSAMLEACGR